MREKLVMVHSVTSSSAQIQMQQLTVNNDSSKFYSYVIQYKENGGNFTDTKTLLQNQNLGFVQTTLGGLQPGTAYVVRVLPMRTQNSILSEPGWPTHGVAFMTTGECIDIML